MKNIKDKIINVNRIDLEELIEESMDEDIDIEECRDEMMNFIPTPNFGL